MAKCDITVSRGITINTGNFGSIRPDVSITVKDVDSEILDKTFKNVSSKLDAMIALEIINLGNEAEAINDISFVKYKANLEKTKDEIELSLEKIKI